MAWNRPGCFWAMVNTEVAVIEMAARPRLRSAPVLPP